MDGVSQRHSKVQLSDIFKTKKSNASSHKNSQLSGIRCSRLNR